MINVSRKPGAGARPLECRIRVNLLNVTSAIRRPSSVSPVNAPRWSSATSTIPSANRNYSTRPFLRTHIFSPRILPGPSTPLPQTIRVLRANTSLLAITTASSVERNDSTGPSPVPAINTSLSSPYLPLPRTLHEQVECCVRLCPRSQAPPAASLSPLDHFLLVAGRTTRATGATISPSKDQPQQPFLFEIFLPLPPNQNSLFHPSPIT